MPDGPWAFDEEVTRAFDDMLQRSIPNYEDMRRAVTEASLWLIDRRGNGSSVIDLGCSRGEALARIVDRVGARARYTGLEISRPMLDAARERFARWESIVDIVEYDLREGYPPNLPPATAVLSVLTLQFVPVEYRQRLLAGVHAHLQPGGGFVLVEKVLGASAVLDAMEVELYHALKRGNGYSQEAIDRKRLSLEGRLVPLTSAFNEELLRSAGFSYIDCVWARMNFRGWVALKDDRG